MSTKNCLFFLLRLAASAAVLAAPAGAQVRDVPVETSILSPAGSAPVALPSFAAAPVLSVPSALLAAPSLNASDAPLAAAPAALAAAAPAPAPPAVTAAFQPYAVAENHETVLGDPAITQSLMARAETIWQLAPKSAKKRPAFRAALAAADYTGAKEILTAVEANERALLGGAYTRSKLAPAIDVLYIAMNRPDHPAIASLRAGLGEAQSLQKDGKIAPAMQKADAVFREFLAGPLARHTHRWAIQLPLVRLQAALKERAVDVYERAAESLGLKIDGRAPGVSDFLRQRRFAKASDVVGDFDGNPIALQKWSDCAIQAIWNLPALKSLHAGTTYERFLDKAEKILNEPIRKQGITDMAARKLLKALGWSRGYETTPRSEEDLLQKIADNGGVIGDYEFKMSRWRSFFTTLSFDGSFSHAVAVPAAVRSGGRWWFVVLDSNYSRPRLMTYGELLTMNFKAAVVTKI
jgi:hypothetical protein